MKPIDIHFVVVLSLSTFLAGSASARPVVVTGRVVDFSAKPVRDATVQFYEIHYAYGEGQIFSGELLNRSGRQLLESLSQRATLDAFHREVGDLALFSNRVDRNDPWMLETGHDLDFALKTLPRLWKVEMFRTNDL